MEYENLIETIIDNIPELKDLAESEKYWWHNQEDEEPLIYVFVGDVLNPFLVHLLDTMENYGLIDRIFGFFESMAKSEDNRVREVLSTGTLEILGDDKDRLKKARSFMRANTLLLSHEIEMSWGRE